MDKSIFLWNLYEVEVFNHKPSIYVCAPSFNGAIKRVNSLIRSWETKEAHSIIRITYISSCLN